jgi:glycosyltransferase involved in cell wall biosynthesis
LSLIVRLERALPETVPVGSATAVFCIGACYHPDARIERLEILVDGIRHRPSAFGMPRPDVALADGLARTEPGYDSGFWGTVPIAARGAPGRVEVALAARLATGAEVTAPLGRIDVVARERPAAVGAQPGRPGPELIAVCMATFEPDMALFEAQLQSLRAQTDQCWICLISDDCSSAERFARIMEAVAGDPQFAVSRSEARLGFYRNFERALRMVPPGADLVALCDQDDRWHPDKLAVLRRSLRDAVLVYSDLRLVDAHGSVLRETLWRGRANSHDNLASMLVANTITGAAMLFRRGLMEIALPFPDPPGFQFHDHWLALAALASGRLAYVDRPLYDYVQHSGAVFGDVTHGSTSRASRGLHGRVGSLHGRVGSLRGRVGSLRGRVGSLRSIRPSPHWRAAYFYGYVSREVQAQVLLARCGSRLTAPKRRTLRRFVACDRSLGALTWLAARPLRRLLGRTETLGSEVGLAQGIVWKRLTEARAHRGRGRGRGRGGPLCDASLPPLHTFSQRRLRRWRARV